MGLWLLLLLSSSVASERPKLHVCEAMDWPFWPIERHPEPDDAKAIMAEIDQLMATVEAEEELLQPHRWSILQDRANELVYAYFRLTAGDIALIEELSSLAGPALQPTSLRLSR